MNQQASNCEEEYKTGNRELVLFFKINGVCPISNHSVGRRKMFTYSRKEIAEKGLDSAWQSGQALMCDLHEVFKAETWFNSLVHDEL